MLQRKIYAIPNTRHYEHYILEIDAEFVQLKRLLFGLKRGEISRGHEFLAEKHPDYLNLPFEEWGELDNPSARVADLSQKSSTDPQVQQVLDRMKERLLNAPNHFQEIYDALAGAQEITQTAYYHPALGVVVRNDDDGYTEYSTQHFSAALRDIVKIIFEEMPDFEIETAAELYKTFENRFPACWPELRAILRAQFEEMKEDTEWVGYTPPDLESDEQIDDMIACRILHIWSTGYLISGKSDWEGEHGFNISVNTDFELTLD